MTAYEALQQILDSHPSTAPRSNAFDKILRLLFTLEEAELAVHMSFKNKTPEDIATAASLPLEETVKRLDGMADKVIIYSSNKDGKKTYGLLPTIPGLFEFPFMKGGGTPELEELGRLWEKYHREALGNTFSGNPTPLMRVVAVEKSVNPQSRVHPHEEIKRLIMNAREVALTECACRVSVGACWKPKDVCIIFDSPARFLAEKGYARLVTREEALEALDRAEKAGLVHTSNNSQDRATVICNCCPCCCTVLRGRTQMKNLHAFEPSRFEARLITNRCSGCALCAEERCPVKAIDIQEGLAIINAKECIGCGLCVSGCPENALELVEREDPPQTPATVAEMGLKVVKEKGRLEEFLKIMSR